jgi:hypothetical protein
MNKIMTMFVFVLSCFCEAHCCEDAKRCKCDGPVYDEQFVKLIREKTPGFKSECDIEVSCSIARDAAIFIWPHRVNQGTGFLNASRLSFIRLLSKPISSSKVEGASEAQNRSVEEIELREKSINAAGKLGIEVENESFDLSRIDSEAAETLRSARLSCLSSAYQYIDNYKTHNDILRSFICIGCLAYCGDVDALKILARLFAVAGNLNLADRAYGAANTEGITWRTHNFSS